MNPTLDLPMILANHIKFLQREQDGARADLRAADLRDANLRGANLHDANLRDANLQGANLQGADLHGANLRDADLQGANLRAADLQGADLRDANLRGASLHDADLRGANLRAADLQGANLRGADLQGADLQGADLRDADLQGADLRDADLPNNVRWDVYLADVVPALLAAGGRPVAEVVTRATCDCHSWTNCPMAEAFQAHGITQVPPLYRREAELFVQLFDGGALTYEVLATACHLPLEPIP